MASKPSNKWKSRIIGEGYEHPEQLLANPKNWRIHPKAQQDALTGMLAEVGWVQRVIVNKRTGFVVDGHMRVEVAISAGEAEVPVLYVDLTEEAEVPVLYVDLTEEEEAKVLATFDPIGGMAAMDEEKFKELLAEVEFASAEARKSVEDAADKAGVELDGNSSEPVSADVARATLAERFIVPPFSVLDARQGYWQERKRAWIAIGIQSELGRGADIVPNGSTRPPEQDGCYRQTARKPTASPGGAHGQRATTASGIEATVAAGQSGGGKPVKMAMANDPMQRKEKYDTQS